MNEIIWPIYLSRLVHRMISVLSRPAFKFKAHACVQCTVLVVRYKITTTNAPSQTSNKYNNNAVQINYNNNNNVFNSNRNNYGNNNNLKLQN